MKKKILILCPYPEGKAPSQRLKYEQYFPAFRAAGYELDIKPFISEAFWKIVYQQGSVLRKAMYTASGYLRRLFQLFTLHRYDIVYIHLWVTPFGWPIFEALVCAFSKKVIYDIDDLVFLGHSSLANRFIQGLKGKKKMIYLMKKADHVITCTPTLDSFVRKYNERTTDISSTIDTDTYTARQNYRVAGNHLVLGWSGSHSTSKYLLLLEPVFERLMAKGIEFKVLVIGDANFRFSNPSIPVEAIPWNRDTEVSDLARIDIGLYPLPDEPWVYGKSGLKALQYMGMGIPTLATRIGANERIMVDGESGILIPVGDTLRWSEEISALAKDENRRSELGKLGRRFVEAHYSVSGNAGVYLEILDGV